MENTQENFSFVANLNIGGFTHVVLFLLDQGVPGVRSMGPNVSNGVRGGLKLC